MGNQKKKRRLSEDEVKLARNMIASAPQGKKPDVRQLARFFGVNQPSILKSLGGWEGIQRNRPPIPEKLKIITPGDQELAVDIKGYTSKIDVSEEDIHAES